MYSVGIALRSLVAASVAIFACSSARADAVGLSDACPFGSHGEVRHVGSWCVISSCDEGCPTHDLPRRCERRRVCTETHRVWAGSPAASAVFGDPGEEDVEMVVETCGAEASCDGHGDRAPVAGTAVEGSLRCEVREVCVPQVLPAFATRLPPEPIAPEPTAPVPAPEAEASGCGCRASTTSPGPWWLVLGCALLIRRRR